MQNYIMQSYQLDLTSYRCPLPLLIVKKALGVNLKPYYLELLINQESERDMELLCEQEKIAIITKENEGEGIKLVLSVI